MKTSYIIAAALALAIGGWMAAGYLTAAPEDRAPVAQQPDGRDIEPMTVTVRASQARDVTRHIVAQGQVEPNRVVTVRAETAGRVADIVAVEGQPVKAGDILARIGMNDRQAQLERAEALVREQRRAHEAAETLGKKGYQTQRRIDETFSALQTAEADLEEIRLEIDNTIVRAPFDGILENRRIEVGDYVAVNGEVATIVDNDPLAVTVQIAQHEVQRIALGAAVTVSFATGQDSDGRVRYIAPRADETTRTFRVEVQVPNPDSRIPSGTSAEARIPTGTVAAHFVSPALLTLDVDGELGVKTVTASDVVAFNPVEIVLAEADGVWVSGLPDEARIIAVGQGFVTAGETVGVAPAGDADPAPAPQISQNPVDASS